MSILKKLQDCSIFLIGKRSEDSFEIYELCDAWYSINLTRDELMKLSVEIAELAKREGGFMKEDIQIDYIGEISNYYGGLCLKREDGVCYWSIENWDGHLWEKITDELFELIIKQHKAKYLD